MTDEQKPGRRPGRPTLPEEAKKKYTSPGFSLRPDQFESLQKLAEILGITSRSGVNFGLPSWRTMIAEIADAITAMMETIRTWRSQPERQPLAIPITPELTLLLTPPRPPEPDPEPQPAPEAVVEAPVVDVAGE